MTQKHAEIGHSSRHGIPGRHKLVATCRSMYAYAVRRRHCIALPRTTMAATPAPAIDVPLLAGPQLLGFFFAWALQGVLSVQTYIYYLLFPSDTIATKILVYGAFVYEWIQISLVTQAAFENNVYNFGNVDSLTHFHNTWFSIPIMCAIISAVVQWYFCWRIFAFSRLKVLVGIMASFAFFQMAVGITGGVLLHALDVSAVGPLPFRATAVFIVWFSSSAAVDVMIAACMTVCLLKSKTGIHRSDALLSRLIRLAIETGTLTATVAILNAVLFAASPIYQCPALLLPKLYANTLLANLNSRAVLRRMDDANYLAELGRALGVNTSASIRFHGMRLPEGHTAEENCRCRESRVCNTYAITMPDDEDGGEGGALGLAHRNTVRISAEAEKKP
ncbi:hypothetical protein C8Q77DRAFT_232671 [Trametes polyzona]|nr:hypothetical protein C8Q77DRAFT_232671 [Trametes polyzona]